MNWGGLLFGLVFVAAGAATGVGIFLHPEGLKAPAFVAYAAAFAFVFAGSFFVAAALRARRAIPWLFAAQMLALFAVAAWTALIHGETVCAGYLLDGQWTTKGYICRSGLAFVAAIAFVIMLIALRAAIASRNDEELR